jgi:hypothetical protein
MNIFSKFMALFQEPAPAPQVVVHDPKASEPRNLDDTFFDEEAKERVGKAIANSKTP